MSKVTLYQFQESEKCLLPLYESRIPAGFPSPADEYLGGKIDLNDYLIQDKTSSFFAKVEGHSMTGAGIFNGDLLVIDRSLQAKNRDIIVAFVDNEFTVKRLDTENGMKLLAENPNYPPIKLTGETECLIWGVVIGVVRKF